MNDTFINDIEAMKWSTLVESPGQREKDLYPFINDWLDLIKPSPLLDIGCGQGILSSIISKHLDYVGVDLSNYFVERAKELYGNQNTHFIVGSCYNLPFEDSFLAV